MSVASYGGGSVEAAEQALIATVPSRLDRLLKVFTDVRAGEGVTGLLMFANVFLLLTSYYFLKPLRDGWIAVAGVDGLSKMEVKAYSSFGQSVLFIFAIWLYSKLASRLPRTQLISRATMVCIAILIFFWLVQPGFLIDYLPGTGIAFYLWVGMFGVFVIAQFWAFAADLYSDEQGSRLLPMIGIGATSGAVFGSFLTEQVVRSGAVDGNVLLLAACIPLVGSIVLTRLADARGPGGMGSARTGTAAQPLAGEPAAHVSDGQHSALRLVLDSRYLIAVAFITLAVNWVNTNGENMLFGVLQTSLEAQATARGITDPAALSTFLRNETTAFYGNLFFWVNIFALLLQAFFTSRLLQHGGFGVAFLLLPIISLFSYTFMAFLPILAVVRFMKIAENATDYSIYNTARQVLWLPTSAETKYKAKPAIETFLVRSGDFLAALTIFVGVQMLDLSLRTFFIVNVVLVLLWLVAAVLVTRDHTRLVKEARHA